MKWQSVWGFSQQDYRSSPSFVDVVNDWIKNQTVFDDVLDFSNFVEDKNDVELLSQNYDLGDWLHLFLKRGQKIADKIDLSQLLN